MSTTAGSEISVLASRVRDPERTAITEAEWLDILSRAQQLWNAITRRVVSTATVTMEPLAAVFALSAVVPDCVRVLSVRDTDHELVPVAQSARRATSPTWMRDSATDPEEWSMLGRDLLVVYPAVAVSRDLTLTYVPHLAPLVTIDTALTIPDHDLPGFRDIAEAIACLKLRQMKLMEAAAGRVNDRMGAAA